MFHRQTLNEPQSKALNLRSRTLIFAVILTLSSVFGIVLLLKAQDHLTLSSTQMRNHYLPVARLLDRARSELNFQIQELGILQAGLKKTEDLDSLNSGTSKISALRPTPAIRALVSLEASKQLPKEISLHFAPWVEKIKEYENDYPQQKNIASSLKMLRDIKARTDLLQRSVDRELSLKILSGQERSRQYLIFWSIAFFVGLMTTFSFIYLVWKWMSPLRELSLWLEKENFHFPPKATTKGWLRPPSEVEDLVENLRKVIYRFSDQTTALSDKTKLVEENERSAQILFSAYLALTKHNEALIQENLKREKLASMGEMAAELAHEIRNPLNGMNLKLELLKSELNSSQQQIVDKILAEIDRLDALTESHLRTTRSRALPLQTKPMKDVILNALDDFQERSKALSIGIQTELDDEVLLGHVPENILKAVLVNLLKNSLEALEEKLQNSSPLENLKIVLELRFSKDKKNWILGIHDTGIGFPPELLTQPIQSFNTTKATGSGLGLATAQKMLKAYNVDLKILSPNEPFASSVYLYGKIPETLHPSPTEFELGPRLS